MSFDCVQCGACCRKVGDLSRTLDRGDGVCRHLTAENLCAVYEIRPLLCRVDEAKPACVSLPDWHAMNKDACKKLHLTVYGRPLPSTPSPEHS